MSVDVKPMPREKSGAVDLYIDLLMKSVGNFIYNDDLDLLRPEYFGAPEGKDKYRAINAKPADSQKKLYGLVWPSKAHTMIGYYRLHNVRTCLETIIHEGIPGDVIETGVWRGGTTIFMRGILMAYGIKDKTVWVADSFEGLPAPNAEKYPQDKSLEFQHYEDLAISLEQVQNNFRRYSLLDDQVKFLKGWFSETLPDAPIEKLSLLRLDGDLYESTMDALNSLYDKLLPGGFVIIDDYDVVLASNEATHDYRRIHGITDEIIKIPGGGAFWRKS